MLQRNFTGQDRLPGRVKSLNIVGKGHWSRRGPVAKLMLAAILACGVLISCGVSDREPTTLFTSLPASKTGIHFANKLTYSAEVNPFSFHSFYNGGGVASGDINNDGLQDLFFCGNQVPNRLYLNKGNFQFEDISIKAQISSQGLWFTGATFADVNGDGWVDLYVCRAADFLVGWRGNRLFINNGDLTFTERSEEYKLANTGFSTHSVFFDYDNDNDLDCYLLSNSNRSSTQYNPIKDQRKLYVDKGGNRLYRNDGNVFVDVTRESGIYSSVIGFGLGVTISDINKDGWQDIYISNDFFERDYLYINKGNGTFDESLEKYIRELSLFSMGADIADINNDAYPDVYVTDMLPEDEGRLKAKTSFETWERYNVNVQKGYYHQFLRNVLQLNRGPLYRADSAAAEYHFSEISRFAGVHASDWSWGALIADLDNDGWKDIFVSNGMFKDVTDQDFIQFVANDSVSLNRSDYKRLIDNLASHPLANFAFHNNGDLTFTNMSSEWGLGEPGFSNGSVYTDLDNDGDLDLVTNNIDAPASIFRNNATSLYPDRKFLKVILAGEGKNLQGFGAKVTVFHNGTKSYLEQMPARGFESSVDSRLNFGLGNIDKIDSLIVEWPGGSVQKMTNVQPNQTITLSSGNATIKAVAKAKDEYANMMMTITTDTKGIAYANLGKTVADFNQDRLLYHANSTHGPRVAVGDVNGDGTEDLFISGPESQPGELYVQNASGSFARKSQTTFEEDRLADETDCLLFDADGDRDLDLFVCSGGNKYAPGSPHLQNRIYINDGKGIFSRSILSLREINVLGNTSSVAASDFDDDGDLDLAVGIRSLNGRYGLPGRIQILQNNGKGEFTDVTEAVVPGFAASGMVTDLEWLDLDNNKKTDLVVCGEFMDIKILLNKAGKLVDETTEAGLSGSSGWWNRLAVADINEDGYDDIIVGNHGLNSRFKASPEKPLSMYVGDFDQNGTTEHIICTYNGAKQYPMVLRHDLVGVIPSLKKKFLKYNDYKNKTIEEIFTAEQLKGVSRLNAYHLENAILLNNKNGTFTLQKLPAEAQFAPVYSLLVLNLDSKAGKEIILGGNLYESKPEAGIYDGSYGQVLRMNTAGKIESIPLGESNFFVEGAIRDMAPINIRGKGYLIITRLGQQVILAEKNPATPALP